jgi:hypothetical protein
MEELKQPVTPEKKPNLVANPKQDNIDANKQSIFTPKTDNAQKHETNQYGESFTPHTSKPLPKTDVPGVAPNPGIITNDALNTVITDKPESVSGNVKVLDAKKLTSSEALSAHLAGVRNYSDTPLTQESYDKLLKAYSILKHRVAIDSAYELQLDTIAGLHNSNHVKSNIPATTDNKYNQIKAVFLDVLGNNNIDAKKQTDYKKRVGL